MNSERHFAADPLAGPTDLPKEPGMTLPPQTRAWLLEAPEQYVRYQALRFLSPKDADPRLLDDDPFIGETIAAVSGWKEAVLERHDKPDLFIHRLAMLADLGVTTETKGIGPIVDGLLDAIGEDGTLPIGISVPTVFGGTGIPSRDWMICDFPVIVYALLRMGVRDVRLERATGKLLSLAGERYYPCCGSIPKFKGPGPRGGMCPYANLLVARAFSSHPEAARSSQARLAAFAVLDHWSERTSKKPFMFGMGTDFLKLKFPMVWYNLLHVLSALSGIEGVRSDPRYLEMFGILRRKPDASGRVKPESVYLCFKSREWGDKKKESRLLTILTHRLLTDR